MIRWFLLGCIALSGCAAPPAVQTAQPNQPLQSASATTEVSPSVAPSPGWEEPDRYAFSVDAGCGLRFFVGRFRITVEHGRVERLVGLDDSSRSIAEAIDPGFVPTLGDMVARVDEARSDARAGVVRLVSDPTDGHPVAVSIDWIEDAIDDEECYDVSDFQVPDG